MDFPFPSVLSFGFPLFGGGIPSGPLLFEPFVHLFLEFRGRFDHIDREFLSVEWVVWVIEQVLRDGGPIDNRAARG